MTRRPRRVIPATLLALAVLAACVLVAVCVIQDLAGQAPVIAFAAIGRRASALRLDGTVMTGAGGAAAGLGLLLLCCALLPGRAETLPLAAAGEHGGREAPPATLPAAGVSRAGLRTAIAAALADVDGITRVRVRVGARRVTVRGRTELDGAETVRADARQQTEWQLGRAGLARQPAVRVVVLARRRTAS